MYSNRYKEDLDKIRTILAETALDAEVTALILTHQKLHDLLWSIVEVVDPEGFKVINDEIDSE
jgi:hypothetical protein